MKKVFIFCLSLVFILNIQSCTKEILLEPTPVIVNNGGLEFSSVKHLTYTSSISGSGVTKVASITIPSNKVWKIESASSKFFSSNSYHPLYNVFIDKHSIDEVDGIFPIWLPAGTFEIEILGITSYAYQYLIAISAIEYNIK